MSILLEALRKSEKNQRSHEVPTIHAEDQSGSASDPLKTGPLALLLVAALFTSGWFVWHQYRSPVAATQPSTGKVQPSVADKQTTTISTQQAAAGNQPPATSKQAPVAKTVDTPRAVTTPPASKTKASQLKAPVKLSDKTARKQRTPMESYKQPTSRIAKANKTTTERPTSKRPETQVADAGNSQSTSTTTTADKPTAVAGQKPRPLEPAPLSYWDLPDAVRANVPEIKFSVLVYANNPADRFVLINGQRLAEGDSPQSNLVVKEIRRDGVIFSYRLYQFLVEK